MWQVPTNPRRKPFLYNRLAMTKRKTAVVILAAGLGTRMKSSLPKVMHPVARRPLIGWALDAASTLAPERIVVVIGPDMDAVAAAVAPWPCAVQEPRLGTGHAVAQAREALAKFDGDVLVIYGDTPFVRPETLAAMLDARAAATDPAVVVLGFRPVDPGAYGRLIVGSAGGLERIVEAKDASPDELTVSLCNSGVMAIDGAVLFDLIDRIGNANAKGEYYLTDIVGLARADGRACAVVEAEEAELMGVNSRADLAVAEALAQTALRARAMDGGATLTDPASVFFAWDTETGRDVTIGPNVVFGPGATIGDNVAIDAFCHIEGASVAEGARVGPFARLRPGADVGANAHIGNFVEIKNAVIEPGAKANHLSYIGDARVGAKANIGAGTITCNYDGYFKSHTDIGAHAFIGSNTALVAPVSVGDGAIIGAGSVVSKDVAADSLAVTRAEQRETKGWARRYHTAKKAKKDAAKRGKG